MAQVLSAAAGFGALALQFWIRYSAPASGDPYWMDAIERLAPATDPAHSGM